MPSKSKTDEPEKLTPEQQHQQDLERLRKMRPMDDTFMREMFRDNLKLAQYVLRIITGIKDLKLISSETQYDLQHLFGARSICLDVLGTDTLNQKYNLEIQRANSGATPKRARYHAGALAVEFLTENDKFDDLPITYIIFITENDVRKKGEPLYFFEKTDRATGEPFGDEEYIIFVNGAYDKKDDKSKLAKLIHDFRCDNADDMYLEKMAKRMRYLKEEPEGVSKMCELMEEMRNETALREKIQFALKLLARGKETLKEIAEDSGLPLEKVKELAKKQAV